MSCLERLIAGAMGVKRKSGPAAAGDNKPKGSKKSTADASGSRLWAETSDEMKANVDRFRAWLPFVCTGNLVS